MKPKIEFEKQPLLVVVTAPSGAGKSTLCRRLLADYPLFQYSVSCTTRAPRGAERDGEAYFFLTMTDFETRMENGEFLEHAWVHGNRYGTLRETVRAAIASGRSVLMDIDVCGAEQVRNFLRTRDPSDVLRRGFIDLFILPPSLEVLRERLERRGEDAPETIAKRLQNATGEMARADEFSHQIVNDNLDRAYAELVHCLGEKVAKELAKRTGRI